MSGQTSIKGLIWYVSGPDGSLIRDIDTDMIFHNAHLAITDLDQMGKHTFGNLDGWKDFPSKAQKGDIVVVGENFGAGSSRQQAVDCFRSLGIAALVGESFGAIYKRNAINSGFPLVTCPGIGKTGLKSGDIIVLDVITGAICREDTRDVLITAEPFSRVQLDIIAAGHLFAYGRTLQNA